MAYIIVKFWACSVQDSTHKILINCGKFNVICDDKMLPLLQLICHTYILFVVVFTPVGQLTPDSDLLVVLNIKPYLASLLINSYMFAK